MQKRQYPIAKCDDMLEDGLLEVGIWHGRTRANSFRLTDVINVEVFATWLLLELHCIHEHRAHVVRE